MKNINPGIVTLSTTYQAFYIFIYLDYISNRWFQLGYEYSTSIFIQFHGRFSHYEKVIISLLLA